MERVSSHNTSFKNVISLNKSHKITDFFYWVCWLCAISLGCWNAACFFPNRVNKRDSFSSASQPQLLHSGFQQLLGFKCHEDTGTSPETLWDGFWSLSLQSLFLASCSSFVCWVFFYHFSKFHKTSLCCCGGLFFLLKTLHARSLHKQVFHTIFTAFINPPDQTSADWLTQNLCVHSLWTCIFYIKIQKEAPKEKFP